MSKATAQATLHTNKGDIVIDLFGNHAPKTVKNPVSYTHLTLPTIYSV